MADVNENESRELKIKSTMRKKKYKNLLDKGANLSTNENADNLEKLEQIVSIIEISNTLNAEGNIKEKTNASTEVLMDTQVIKMSYELMGSTMQKLGNDNFSDEMYAIAIKKLISEAGELNWSKMAGETSKIIRTAKFSQSLLGTFDFEPIVVEKPVKERMARKEKPVMGELETPETVDKQKPKEKLPEKIKIIMSQLIQLFQTQNNIPYYALITDPESFPNTVDNAFQLAFLVRDGTLKLDIDEKNEPLVSITSKELRSKVNNSSNNCQATVNLNKRIWRNNIEKFNIRRPLLVIDRQID